MLVNHLSDNDLNQRCVAYVRMVHTFDTMHKEENVMNAPYTEAVLDE
jgi:hypothetical protein